MQSASRTADTRSEIITRVVQGKSRRSACRSAAYCGVSLLATAHASDAEELSQRDVYQRLLRDKVFFRAIVIRCADGCRSYEEVML